MRYSVITVCRNDLAGLQATYASLASQDERDYEWIVVDGASADATVEWLKALPAGTADWSSEKDKGLYDAMNKGIERAHGEWLIFMNSADTFASPDVLSRVSRAIDGAARKPVFVYGDAIDGTPEGGKLYRPSRPHARVGRGMFTHHQAMFFSREGLGDIRYELRFPLSADYAFVSRMLTRHPEAGKALRMPFAVAIFAPGGVSSTRRARAMREDYVIRREILGQGLLAGGLLFVAHRAHLFAKTYAPAITSRMRYTSNAASCPR